jgi:hypothetical protein
MLDSIDYKKKGINRLDGGSSIPSTIPVIIIHHEKNCFSVFLLFWL